MITKTALPQHDNLSSVSQVSLLPKRLRHLYALFCPTTRFWVSSRDTDRKLTAESNPLSPVGYRLYWANWFRYLDMQPQPTPRRRLDDYGMYDPVDYDLVQPTADMSYCYERRFITRRLSNTSYGWWRKSSSVAACSTFINMRQRLWYNATLSNVRVSATAVSTVARPSRFGKSRTTRRVNERSCRFIKASPVWGSFWFFSQLNKQPTQASDYTTTDIDAEVDTDAATVGFWPQPTNLHILR